MIFLCKELLILQNICECLTIIGSLAYVMTASVHTKLAKSVSQSSHQTNLTKPKINQSVSQLVTTSEPNDRETIRHSTSSYRKFHFRFYKHFLLLALCGGNSDSGAQDEVSFCMLFTFLLTFYLPTTSRHGLRMRAVLCCDLMLYGYYVIIHAYTSTIMHTKQIRSQLRMSVSQSVSQDRFISHQRILCADLVFTTRQSFSPSKEYQNVTGFLTLFVPLLITFSVDRAYVTTYLLFLSFCTRKQFAKIA